MMDLRLGYLARHRISFGLKIGLFQKRQKEREWVGGVGALRTYFFENSPGIFRFFTLPTKIPDKPKLHP